MSERERLVDIIWLGRDPFIGFEVAAHPADVQGWNSSHEYLSESIETLRPKIVVEVGVWKGGSVITMASKARSLGMDCVIIAVDTWLGSFEHWLTAEGVADLRLRHGYPQLYHTFASNIIRSGLEGMVVPLPLDSINALHFLAQKRVMPDLIHIDAGHDYRSASADLEGWWPLLAPGGMLIGDDYYVDGEMWPDVRRAFDDFLGRNLHHDFKHGGGKCMFRKP